MGKYKASWQERESGSAGEGHYILSKCQGRLIGKVIFGQRLKQVRQEDLQISGGKNKWKSAPGGVCLEVREHQGSGLGLGAGELCKGRGGSYFLPNFYNLCIVIFCLNFDIMLKYYLSWLLSFSVFQG